MKKRFLLSIGLIFATIVAMGQALNPRITAFDLQDADGHSLILGYNAANATGATSSSGATAAVFDFIYKTGVDLSNVNLVTTIATSAGGGQVVSPLPTDFSAHLQLTTVDDAATYYCLYDVNPRELKPVELPATMDLATAFASGTTEGWAAARLTQAKPGNLGSVPSLSYPAAGVITLLSFSNVPDMLSFTIATNATTNGNVFDVYESTDGINWNSSIASYSDAAGTIPLFADAATNQKSVKLSATTRFVKLILSARTAGNFYLYGISATAGTQTGMQNAPVTTAKVSVQNGLLNILSDKAIAGLDIFTANGQLVVNAANPSKQINVSNLLSGCYIVKIKNIDGQTSVCRFVK